MPQLRQRQWVRLINLVHHNNLWWGLNLLLLHNLGNHRVHGLNLFQRERIGAVNYMQHQVRLNDFLQSRTERFHQLCGQVTDKTNGIRKHYCTPVR